MFTVTCVQGTGEVPLSSTSVSEGEDLPVDGVDRATRSSDAELFGSYGGSIVMSMLSESGYEAL